MKPCTNYHVKTGNDEGTIQSGDEIMLDADGYLNLTIRPLKSNKSSSEKHYRFRDNLETLLKGAVLVEIGNENEYN